MNVRHRYEEFLVPTDVPAYEELRTNLAAGGGRLLTVTRRKERDGGENMYILCVDYQEYVADHGDGY